MKKAPHTTFNDELVGIQIAFRSFSTSRMIWDATRGYARPLMATPNSVFCSCGVSLLESEPDLTIRSPVGTSRWRPYVMYSLTGIILLALIITVAMNSEYHRHTASLYPVLKFQCMVLFSALCMCLSVFFSVFIPYLPVVFYSFLEMYCFCILFVSIWLMSLGLLSCHYVPVCVCLCR